MAIPSGRSVPTVTTWASLSVSHLAALTEPFAVVLLPLQEQKDEPQGYTDHS